MEENKKDGLKEIRGEFKKIVWPNRHELYKQTVTVVITSLFFGLIIFVLNVVYSYLFSFLH